MNSNLKTALKEHKNLRFKLENTSKTLKVLKTTTFNFLNFKHFSDLNSASNFQEKYVQHNFSNFLKAFLRSENAAAPPVGAWLNSNID